jgi:hypothetical protein
MARGQNDDRNAELALWSHFVKELLAKGATLDEAIDGADILIEAHRRAQAERERHGSGGA